MNNQKNRHPTPPAAFYVSNEKTNRNTGGRDRQHPEDRQQRLPIDRWVEEDHDEVLCGCVDRCVSVATQRKVVFEGFCYMKPNKKHSFGGRTTYAVWGLSF